MEDDDFIFIEVDVFHNLKIQVLQRSLIRITCLFHMNSLGRSPCWPVLFLGPIIGEDGCPHSNIFHCVPTNNF